MGFIKEIEYNGICYKMQGFTDISFEDLCQKQGIEITGKNAIYEQKNALLDFTEYRYADKYAYELIVPHGDEYECGIIIMSSQQDYDIMYKVFMKYRNSKIEVEDNYEI